MKTLVRNMTSRLFALLIALALAFAQGGAQAQPAYAFSQQELDQMLAPIALYPDALLSQILMAATYPLEVVEAARWSRARPGLAGDDAVRAAQTEDWDPSVKSLVAFPQALARMDENPQWTQALGDAFLGQETQVMDTVQALRHRAQAAGTLRSDDHVSVVQSGPSLLVQPFDPEVVYAPYYDPLVVYGSWWWPASPPMYLRPWPGYYARPAYAGRFYWGPPVGISPGFFFGTIDWRQRQVRVAQVNDSYYNLTAAHQANAGAPPRAGWPGAWHHDPDHRRGLNYRSPDLQQRFGAANRPADRGYQARAADARRSDGVSGARSDTRFEARRPDTRAAIEPRPNLRPATVAPAIPVMRPMPVVQAPPVMPVVKPLPVMQAPPVVQAAPAARGGWHAVRPEPGPRFEAPRTPQPRMEIRPAPSVARHEPAHMAAARHEPAARQQIPQASAPRADSRPLPAAARQDPGANVVARLRMVP